MSVPIWNSDGEGDYGLPLSSVEPGAADAPDASLAPPKPSRADLPRSPVEEVNKETRRDHSARSALPDRDQAVQKSLLSERFWRWFDQSRPRGYFVLTVVAGLTVLLLAPVVSSLPSLPLKIIAPIYRFVADTEGQHNLANAVENRPFWTSKPQVFGASLDTVVNPQGGQTSQTDGDGNLDFHSVEGVVANAANDVGFPTEVVGRVVSESTITSDILAPIGEEFELAGAGNPAVVYVGVAPDMEPGFTFSTGNVVAVRGVVVATGTARQLNRSERSAAYMIGFDGDLASNEAGAHSLAQEIRSAGR